MNDVRFTFMCPDVLRDRVKTEADRADLSVAQWLRAAIREKLERDAQPS